MHSVDTNGDGKISLKELRVAMARATKAEAAGEEFNETEAMQEAEKAAGNPDAGSAIVVKEESAWDNMGAKLKDMPFLSSF